jgi:hypothetical protein
MVPPAVEKEELLARLVSLDLMKCLVRYLKAVNVKGRYWQCKGR